MNILPRVLKIRGFSFILILDGCGVVGCSKT